MTAFIHRAQDAAHSRSEISLFVGGLHNAAELAEEQQITHAISILDPAYLLPNLGLHHSRHRGFTMIDTEDPRAPKGPQPGQVREVLQFAREMPPGARLLIHCHAGISRSSACALAVLAQRYGVDDADWLVDVLTNQVCDRPIPNLLISRHADQILELKGALFRLAVKIGSIALQEQHGLVIQRGNPSGP